MAGGAVVARYQYKQSPSLEKKNLIDLLIASQKRAKALPRSFWMSKSTSGEKLTKTVSKTVKKKSDKLKTEASQYFTFDGICQIS